MIIYFLFIFAEHVEEKLMKPQRRETERSDETKTLSSYIYDRILILRFVISNHYHDMIHIIALYNAYLIFDARAEYN
jgi:hypothetical protein